MENPQMKKYVKIRPLRKNHPNDEKNSKEKQNLDPSTEKKNTNSLSVAIHRLPQITLPVFSS